MNPKLVLRQSAKFITVNQCSRLLHSIKVPLLHNTNFSDIVLIMKEIMTFSFFLKMIPHVGQSPAGDIPLFLFVQR